MPDPSVQVTVRLPLPVYSALCARYPDLPVSKMVLRTLESALGSPTEPVVAGPAIEENPSAPAQTRTSEESSRSSSEQPGSASTVVAGSAKESASPGPASTGSGRGPRRSSEAKQGVRPIKRAS